MDHAFLSSLRQSDEHRVSQWLRLYLLEHCTSWFESIGMPHDEATMLRHLQTHHMIETHWRELWESAQPTCSDAHVFVERDEDEMIVGIIFVEVDEDRYMKVPMGSIGWIAVCPEHQGQGISHRLMAQAELWFEQVNARGVEVFVSQWNTRALGLYSRHHFFARDTRMLK